MFCVGLAYHPKLVGFARTVGIERFILPNEVHMQRNGQYGNGFHELAIEKTALSEPAV